jgi:hypothetical protein
MHVQGQLACRFFIALCQTGCNRCNLLIRMKIFLKTGVPVRHRNSS